MTTKDTTLPISQARKKIFEIAEDVQTPGRHYTLTEKGYPKAVVMSAEEYESWAETLEVIQDFPDLDKDIKALESDIKSGKYKSYTTLDETLKTKNVQTKTKAASRKRTRKSAGKRS